MADTPQKLMTDEDPYHFIMHVFMSKWKPFILTAIYFDNGSTRYNKFTATFPISNKVLTENLRELEADGLIEREFFPEIPPHVEYHLTPIGETVIPLLFQLYDWGWNEMNRRNIPIDKRGQMYHGYMKPDPEMMGAPKEEYLQMLQAKFDKD